MTKVFDGILGYPGLFKRPVRCHLALYIDDRDRSSVAVLTEIKSNPGASITNTIEAAAGEALCLARIGHGADPSRSTYVERYADSRGERLALVTFSRYESLSGRFCGPCWHHLTRHQLEAAIGAPLAVAPEGSY